jgi:hypothetical protein
MEEFIRSFRTKPFGLTIVLNGNGDAEGDLFYDDGDSIDTIQTKAFYFATFQWSSSQRQLSINVKENSFAGMSTLKLETLTIYGLDNVPTSFNVNGREIQPRTRPFTQIIEVNDLELPMGQNAVISWSSTGTTTIDLGNIPSSDPKYRVDCFPDSGPTQAQCLSRGCLWENPIGAGIPACYIPKEKGGYGQTDPPSALSDSVTRYSLSRLSSKPTDFSIYGGDIDHLNVQVSVSGTDLIRVTIRDEDRSRYEVPVPIRWQSSAVPSSAKAKIQFEMTKTSSGQAGFRVRRTVTQSIIFDTSYFAEGFIYSDQYLQLITTIPSRNVYGTKKSFDDLLYSLSLKASARTLIRRSDTS